MASNSNQPTQKEIVLNFRQVADLPKIYRSGTPEGAVQSIACVQNVDDGDPPRPLSDAEQFVLYDVDFWIDLRGWDGEADNDRCTRIMDGAPGGAFQRLLLHDMKVLEDTMISSSMTITDDGSQSGQQRHRFYMNFEKNMVDESMNNFILEHNLLSVEKMNQPPPTDERERRESELERRTSVFKELLNEENHHHHHGLVGLNHMILQTHELIVAALQAITISLEQRKDDGRVLVHCTMGKDRTGIVVMLCQAMAGVDDEVIIDDYAKSDIYQEVATRKLATHYARGDELDLSPFAGAGPKVMADTLEIIRNENGSIDGYLDKIGFDESWRQRFVAAVSNWSMVGTWTAMERNMRIEDLQEIV